MEEKESTVSGSLGNNSDTDSQPPPVTSVMSVNNVSMQVLISNSTDTISATTTITAPPVAELQAAAAAPAPAPTIFGNAGNGGIGSGGEREKAILAGKKKRGRPRKYDSDGKLRVQQQQPIINQIVAQPFSPPPGFSLTPSPDFHGFSSSKRGKGRPQGSGNWQVLSSLGELFAKTAGGDFTPHVVTVSTGEDVAGKILSFSHKGPRGICVLSANGAVSNVTIRQPGSSGGILTYEGRFEILSLSGSFMITETGGVRNRIGGLSVSLASPDGRVIGGGVAGLLLAASPIQIVVGSFMPNGYKAHKRKHSRENAVTSVIPGSPDMIPAARPITEVKPADGTTIVIPTAPLAGPDNGGTDDGNANEEHTPNAAHPSSDCWNGTQPASNYRPSPDINVPVPKEEDIQSVF